MSTETRLITLEDAEELTEVLVANEPFLAPWEPLHGPEFFSVATRREAIAESLHGYRSGQIVPQVITTGGQIIGQITLAPIVRGAMLSATVGYWVAEAHNRQGHATAAVDQTCSLAFHELGLHRLEAPVLAENPASQRVLTQNRFKQYGVATRYLRIAGRWRDHLMFERLCDEPERG